MINFSIEGTPYQAEEGMTWEQWVNSKYNTGRYILVGNYIESFNRELFVKQVQATDTIKGQTHYSLANHEHTGGGSL